MAKATPPAAADAGDVPQVQMAQDLMSAWNAHDVEWLLALFAPDASVRQRGAQITQFGPNVQIDDVFGVSMDYVGDPPRSDGHVVIWAAGRAEIRVWAGYFVAAGHQVVAAKYRLSGNTVTWEYQVPPPVAWQRAIPRLAPSRGVAEAVVVDGAIQTFTIASAPGAAEARQRAIASAAATASGRDAHGARRATAPPGGPPDTQDRRSSSRAPWTVAGLVALATTILAAIVRPATFTMRVSRHARK